MSRLAIIFEIINQSDRSRLYRWEFAANLHSNRSVSSIINFHSLGNINFYRFTNLLLSFFISMLAITTNFINQLFAK